MNKTIRFRDIVGHTVLLGMLTGITGGLLYTSVIFIVPNLDSTPINNVPDSINGVLVFFGLIFGLIFGLAIGLCDGMVLGVLISSGLLKPLAKLLHRALFCFVSALTTAIGTMIGMLYVLSNFPNADLFKIVILPSVIAAIGGWFVAYLLTSPRYEDVYLFLHF